jgi:hypothetical protein
MKQNFERIEAEIRKEKAEALGRTGERLERILLELADLRKALVGISTTISSSRETARGDDSDAFCVKIERYARLREQAQRIRHHLVIQREAVGLRRHEDVERQYPLPPPLTFARNDRDKDAP